MSHPVPGHTYGENEYPEEGYKSVDKSPKKPRYSGVREKLEHMAHKLKGLQETKHFGAPRRARHIAAKKAKLTGSKIPF